MHEPDEGALGGTATEMGGEAASTVAGSTKAPSTEGAYIPDRAGRFALLKQIGRGSMGVVYAAYDDVLDRKVAVKFIDEARARSEHARQRMLREAKAMARVSHANVVHVYEAGQADGRVFIAMEFVDGGTLRDWLDARGDHRGDWRARVEMFAVIGRGLAAAHDAEVVHRDFKPDNVLMTATGVPKVADFGLAGVGDSILTTDSHANTNSEKLALTATGDVIGTPLYMSPEQHGGGVADARSDQFSFCVAMYEALYGARPFGGETRIEIAVSVLEGRVRDPPSGTHVPGWIRDIIVRGLSVDPEDRFASMARLVDALVSGRRRARRRRFAWMASTGVLVGALPWAWQRWEEARRTADCEKNALEIEADWNAQVRESLRTALLSTELRYAAATADTVIPQLDRYAEEWKRARHSLCLDETGAGSEAATHPASLRCLLDRRRDMRALVEEFSSGDASIAGAVKASISLEKVSDCLDPNFVRGLPAPPEQTDRAAIASVEEELSRAWAAEAAGRFEKASKLVEAALSDANALGWPPLRAQAGVLAGRLRSAAGRIAEAERVLEEAYFDALTAGIGLRAADAAIELIAVVGAEQSRHAEGLRWGRHAEVLLAKEAARIDVRHFEANRLTHLALVATDAGDLDQARDHYEHARDLLEEALGRHHPALLPPLNNLANVHTCVGAVDQALRLHERALEIAENTLAPDHPDVGRSLAAIARLRLMQGKYDAAMELFERALTIQTAALGEDHPQVADTLVNVGYANWARGDKDRARELWIDALDIRERALGPNHLAVSDVLTNIGSAQWETGALEEARVTFERALRIQLDRHGPTHPDTAICLANLGGLLFDQGRIDEARRHLEQAMQIYDAHEGIQAGEADAAFGLAKAIAAGDTDSQQALALARRAADAWRMAGSSGAQLREVEAWIADLDP